MDQRRTSGFSLNSKFRNMHQMVSDKKLKKEIGTIEQEFAKDVSRLRKETLAIKQDYFKLKKERGFLNVQALQQLEFSPGLQDRNTRSRRFGAFDPAMLKARDDVDTPPKEDNRTFAEKRKDMLLQKHLSSIPMDDFVNEDKVDDPYRRGLDRILGNSKLAKEARLTALKVKALEAMAPPSGTNIGSSRRESHDSFSDAVYKRSRILSMPTTGTTTHKPHLLARRSMSDALHKSNFNSRPSVVRVQPKAEPTEAERVRKRSNSMTPTTLMTAIDNNVLRRRSDTPINYSGKMRLETLDEQSKLPDVVQN